MEWITDQVEGWIWSPDGERRAGVARCWLLACSTLNGPSPSLHDSTMRMLWNADYSSTCIIHPGIACLTVLPPRLVSLAIYADATDARARPAPSRSLPRPLHRDTPPLHAPPLLPRRLLRVLAPPARKARAETRRQQPWRQAQGDPQRRRHRRGRQQRASSRRSRPRAERYSIGLLWVGQMILASELRPELMPRHRPAQPRTARASACNGA